MEFENLLKLIDKVSKSDLDSFSYEEDGTKIKLGKNKKNYVAVDGMTMTGEKTLCTQVSSESTTAVSDNNEEIGFIVKSPLVGVFYAAPSEDAEPFVTVGDSVKKGQTLAIIEAMKLMNEIESESDGVVKEIYVKNGEAVEYGQPLFMIG